MFLNVLFLLSAAMIILGGLALVVTKNIMHSCIYLLFVLLGVAGLYVTLDAPFVAVTQVMVYVGGVVILMMFAIMLTGGKDYISRGQKLFNLAPLMGSKYTLSFAIAAVVLLGFILFALICDYSGLMPLKEGLPQFTAVDGSVERIGEALVGRHVFAFEMSSILLLGALIGAAIIARPNKSE